MKKIKEEKELQMNGGVNVKMKRSEKGITLIALIITIIILVILAAVSIRAVTNMRIVDYAVNGSENYAKAGKAENKTLDDTVSFIDQAVEKVNKAVNGTDYSAEILSKINGEFYWDVMDKTLTLEDGTKSLPLGPSYSEWSIYYLCDGKIYKAILDVLDEDGSCVTAVSMTNKDASTLGYNQSTGKLTTADAVFTNADFTTSSEFDPDTTKIVKPQSGDFAAQTLYCVYDLQGILISFFD